MINILAFETSCDETAAAVVAMDRDGSGVGITSEVVASQIELHAEYGGVVPELASREHLRLLPVVLRQTLKAAGLSVADVDAIAVTKGPGLLGCLLTGMSFAKGLALSFNKPLLGIHHLEGHLVAPYLTGAIAPQYPLLTLIVSGGHTALYLVGGFGVYQRLARTIDDAAGEAFDKAAHLLGFAYPGGARLAAAADVVAAAGGPVNLYTLPVAMQGQDDFSFSGVKTAISSLIAKVAAGRPLGKLTEQDIGDIAFAIQEALVASLVSKLKRAVLKTGVNRVVLTGGVAANRRLREVIAALPGIELPNIENANIELIVPSFQHCTDNGAMIALAAGWRYLAGERGDEKMGALSRWPLENLSAPAAAMTSAV